jgi:putative ABC transport system ATP-binding protein
MPILETRSISKTYTAGDRKIAVLDSVSLAVADGEFLVVQGESGSGKSTLLSILSGLDSVDSGTVLIDGKDITNCSEDELAPLRNSFFGFVFQSFHLVPSLTALENIMFPAELRGDRSAQEKAEELLRRVGLSDRGASFPHQLSGGEKQRCAICRALVNGPRIIFADEPTGNLDSMNGASVLELLLELHQERRTTLVLVTHSREIAGKADRVVLLRDGRIASGRDDA